MKKSGFSLIELMVLVAIIAVAAALLIPRFHQEREKMRPVPASNN